MTDVPCFLNAISVVHRSNLREGARKVLGAFWT